MRSSIQSRVVALVGAGVFVAVGALSLLSRSSLMVLEGEVVEQHHRVAEAMARELSRSVTGDMRLLAVAAGAPDEVSTRSALDTILSFGHVTSSAFVVTPDGILSTCEPAGSCEGLVADAIRPLAVEAIRTQRPVVSNRVRGSRTDPESKRPHPEDRLVCLMPLRGERGSREGPPAS